MATIARAIHCKLISPKSAITKREQIAPVQIPVQKAKVNESENLKIVLQPRLCTLRSYGSDPVGLMKSQTDGSDEVLPFFESLTAYIESSKKSQDVETISGRLAMMVFAATVATEVVTGNSLFRKMELEGIAETVGLCLGAMTCAAAFAWLSSARNRVGRVFTIGCNTFIDSLIDQIVDGLFYEIELNDWSDDI